MYGTFNIQKNIQKIKEAQGILDKQQNQQSSVGDTYPFTVQRLGDTVRVFNAATSQYSSSMGVGPLGVKRAELYAQDCHQDPAAFLEGEV